MQYKCTFYCVPEHGNFHGMARHMQTFHATKTLRKVIKLIVSIQKLGVPDIRGRVHKFPA